MPVRNPLANSHEPDTAVDVSSGADILLFGGTVPQYTTGFSFAGWFKFGGIRITGDTTAVFVLESLFASGWRGFHVNNDTDVIGYSVSGVFRTLGVAMTPGDWYYLAASEDSSFNMRALVAPVDGPVTTITAVNSTATFVQGAIGGDAFGRYSIGSYAHWKLWNATLTYEELILNKQLTAPIVRPRNVLSYWKLNSTPRVKIDSVGINNATGFTGTGGWTTTDGPVFPGNTKPSNDHFLEPLDPNGDYLSAAGIYLQSATSIGATNVGLARSTAGELRLFDAATNVALNQIGQPGPTGPDGVTGAIGAIGPTGGTGLRGPTGVTGVIGAIGADGIQGATGPAGATGIAGVTGAGGPGGTGPAGSNLQQAYDYTSTIQLNAARGPVVLQEPDNGGISGNHLLRVDNNVTGGPTGYFIVTPTGIVTERTITGRRLDLNGTPLTGSDFSLARWGSGASAAGNYGVTNITGGDSHGSFTVISGATGYSLNPRITFNFKDGPRANAPFVLTTVVRPVIPTNANLWGYSTTIVQVTVSPTNVQWYIAGSPSARSQITITFISLG